MVATFLSAFRIMGSASFLLGRGLLAVVVASVLAEIAVATILAPIGAAALDWLVGRSGRYAVTNEDLIGFALSPVGLLTILAMATVALAGRAVGQSAAILALHRGVTGGSRSGIAATADALRRFPLLARLALRQAIELAVLALPWLIVMGAIAWIALRGVDLYWMVNTRPMRFWVALVAMAPCALLGGFFVGRRGIAWSIAMPACILDGAPPGRALAESAAQLRGRLLMVTMARGGWLLAALGIGAALVSLLHLLAEGVLGRESGSLSRTALLVGAVLVAQTVAVTMATVAAVAGDGAIVLAMRRAILGEKADAPWVLRDANLDRGWSLRRAKLLVVALLLLAGAGAVFGGRRFADAARRPIAIEITAHRGAASMAPENTMAAIRLAYELGADRSEIDVMTTRDQRVIVFHDTDLRRIAGDSRRIADLELDAIREIDVGAGFTSVFGTEFHGEGIPTLDEVLAFSASRIPLNIELKVVGDPSSLVVETVAAVRAAGAAGGNDQGRSPGAAVITSLSQAALEAVRREDPTIPIGLIVTAALGDVRRADVDFLSVDASIATPDFLRRSAAAGLPVHVWGVHTVDEFTRLALEGIDGVITPDVGPMKARLAELQSLDELERLLLAFRVRIFDGQDSARAVQPDAESAPTR